MIWLDSNTKINSHADTCVLGWNAHIFLDHERPVYVDGYDMSKGTFGKGLATVSGALAYNDPIMGLTFMLIIHQAIDCSIYGH